MGDEKLCARENDFRSLSLYVQSDENLGSKVLKVTKSKRLPFDVFDKLVSGFQFGIGIRLLQSVGNISSPLVKSSATSSLITRVPEVKLFGLAQTKYLRFYTCEVV